MRRARNGNARVPFRHGNRRTDRCPSALRPCHRDPDRKTLRYILPTKVQARLPRLSRAYAQSRQQSPLSVFTTDALPYFTPLREAQGETAVIDRHASVVRRHRSAYLNYKINARYISRCKRYVCDSRSSITRLSAAHRKSRRKTVRGSIGRGFNEPHLFYISASN